MLLACNESNLTFFENELNWFRLGIRQCLARHSITVRLCWTRVTKRCGKRQHKSEISPAGDSLGRALSSCSRWKNAAWFTNAAMSSCRSTTSYTVHTHTQWHNVHSQQHTHMSSSYRSSRLGLSHWDPYAMHRGSCPSCIIVTWWSGPGGNQALSARPISFSALTLLVWSYDL